MVENKLAVDSGFQNQQLTTYRNLLLRHSAYAALPLKALIVVTPSRLPAIPGFRSIRRWCLGQVEWGEVLDQLRQIAPSSDRDRQAWLEMLQLAAGRGASTD